MTGGIDVFPKWGDPRRQAAAAGAGAGGREVMPHGMTPSAIEQMRSRFDSFLPNMSGMGAPYTRARAFFDGMLPEGATLDPGAGSSYRAAAMATNARARAGASGRSPGAIGGRAAAYNMPYGAVPNAASSGGGFYTNQKPYQPEFESPDRQNYPIHRALANIYWRMFYKLDPIIGTCIDMFAEMLWSNFELSGEGVEGEIKEALEHMCEITEFRSWLPYFVKEYLVIGEVAPHLFWSDDEGLWTHIALHNPDQLEIIDAPFLDMEPLIEFKPEEKLRQILTSNNPMLKSVRESMPEEILSALISGQNIPLSPINCTFIPRKLHPYEIRGTSLIARMWRILMFEDALFAAAIAIARRNAAPLKVAKMGDRATGWIPDPAQELRFLELIAQAELDPASWLCWHYGIEFDLVGAQERTWKVDQSAEFIERTKMIALGVSKSFLHGEVTYACLPEGTPVRMADHTSVPVEEIRPGARVVGRDGRIETVARAWDEGTPKTLTEIELIGGKTIRSTHNHRWPVWAWPRECACGCGGQLAKLGQRTLHGHGGAARARGVTFVDVDASSKPRRIPTTHEPHQVLPADELRAHDCLLVPRRFEPISVPKVSRAHARLLGYYVAEGCRKAYNQTGRFTTTFCLSADEADTFAVDIERCLDELGVSHFRHNEDHRLYVETTAHAALDLQAWLAERAGHGAKLKQLSEEVMRWPLDLKEELVRGAFRGDGHQTLSTRTYKGKVSGPYLQVGYTTASETLAEQLWTILIQLGFFLTLGKRERFDMREEWKDWTISHELLLQSDGAQRLADLVWGPLSRSGEVARERDVRATVRFDDDYAYVPIVAVRTVKNRLPVHNIEVTGTHTYLADGVATCNSAASGLAVFLQRLKALREYFESVWIYPKFFRPVAEMNGWVKPTQAELDHRVRTKRSQRELRESNRYIVPKIEWDRPLDPSIDSAMIQAITALSGLGVKFSKTTLASLVNRDYETELGQVVREAKLEQDLLAKHPELQMALAQGAEAGGAGPGGGLSPGLPPDALGMEDPGAPPPDAGGAPPDAGGAPPTADAGDNQPHGGTEGGDRRGYGAWHKDEVKDLIAILRDGDQPEEEPWTRMYDDWTEAAQEKDPYARAALRALAGGDPQEAWAAVEEWLLIGGYPPRDVRDLTEILRREKVLPGGRQAGRPSRPPPAQAPSSATGGRSLEEGGTNLFAGVGGRGRRR
jgi:hypothetical protein